ncbi:carotenoid biosynthesis protein [Halobacterium yunchengense]|uniref:carotenoid biosynthesis protein n=1 Tax=Halobacterium yunchengense TaxID=3108497 RepID=UPI00300B42D5
MPTVSHRAFAASAAGLGVLALAHAALTWPPAAVLAFFAGGAAVAFVAEAVVVNLGWLEHHVGPKALGVPLYVLLAWVGTLYVAFRVALLVTTDWPAVALTAVLATGYDVLSDNRGVADGRWTYTDDLPGPRHGAVPWWNYAGWLLISATTAAFGTLAL